MLSTGSDWCRLNELAITGLLKEEGRIASSENKKAALNGAARSQTPYASSRSHWWGGTSATSVDVCIAPHECLNRSSHGRSQVVSKRTNVINRFFGRCRIEVLLIFARYSDPYVLRNGVEPPRCELPKHLDALG
jgi:hypothetical protein